MRAVRGLGDDAGLIGGLGFDLRDAAAGIGPAGFGLVIAGRVEGEGSAARGDDIGRVSGISAGFAGIAGGGDEGDALVAGGGGEVGVELGFGGGFVAAEAHGDDRDAGLLTGEVDRGEEVGGAGVGRFDEHDRGAGGHGVGPFDVQRFFAFKVVIASAGGIDGREGSGGTGLADDFERGGREAEGGVKTGKVRLDGGVVVGVDDGDGLTGTIAGNGAESNLVHAIGGADFGRRISFGPGALQGGKRPGGSKGFIGGCERGHALHGGGSRCFDGNDFQRSREKMARFERFEEGDDPSTLFHTAPCIQHLVCSVDPQGRFVSLTGSGAF